MKHTLFWIMVVKMTNVGSAISLQIKKSSIILSANEELS